MTLRVARELALAEASLTLRVARGLGLSRGLGLAEAGLTLRVARGCGCLRPVSRYASRGGWDWLRLV